MAKTKTAVKNYTRKNGQKVKGHVRLFKLPIEAAMLKKAQELAASPHYDICFDPEPKATDKLHTSVWNWLRKYEKHKDMPSWQAVEKLYRKWDDKQRYYNSFDMEFTYGKEPDVSYRTYRKYFGRKVKGNPHSGKLIATRYKDGRHVVSDEVVNKE